MPSPTLSLFDWAESIARKSDKETSHVAACKIATSLVGLRLDFVRILGELGQATANEVAARLTDNYSRRESIRKRAGELAKAGVIVEVGRRECGVTGNLATVYEVRK